MKNKEHLIGEKKLNIFATVELIFAFLPLITSIFIKLIAFRINIYDIISKPDFSFLAMILYGQTLIKLFHGLIVNKNEKNPILLLVATLILCLGFIPSIIYLVLIEIGTVNQIISSLQIIWLIISVVIFLVFGRFAMLLSENEKITENNFIKTNK